MKNRAIWRGFSLATQAGTAGNSTQTTRPTPLQMGNALNNRQTQPRPIHPARQSKKWQKHGGTLRLRNARAMICHPPRHALLRTVYRQCNPRPAIAQSIVDQIGEHLTQQLDVPHQRGFAVFRVKADLHPF